MRRQIAGRQDRDIGIKAGAGTQRDADPVFIRFQRDRLIRQQGQSVPCLPPYLVQHGAEIGAIIAPRGEAAFLPKSLLLQPCDEMARLVGQGAHIGGADIENMSGLRRAIGKPPAEPVAMTFHQCHAERTVAQQVDGQQCAAEASSNDGGMVDLQHGSSISNGSFNIACGTYLY